MFNNSIKLIFILSLFISSLISISSFSWFNMWMGLEINLLSFIPLIMKLTDNLSSTEASIKYFLIQAFSSNLLLFFIIFFSFFSLNHSSKNLILNFFIILVISMKMGTAPFHIWFIQISENLNWMNNLILMTWQKIAPLIIISYCFNFFLFNFLSLYTILIGTIGGLNQISLRKLMAYSSINHLGWLLLSIMINMNSFKLYFFMYVITTMTISIMFNTFNFFFLNQLFNKTFSIYLKFLLNLPILSLGGLPPLLGFFPKWMVLEMLIKFNFIFLSLYICYFSLFAIFFYIRIMYNFLLLNHFETKISYKKKNNLFSLKLIIMNSLLLMFTMFSLFFFNLMFSF
uniref:NADH dehydrogenase subunit 2 n=1 Tax=Stenochironomus tobaduodecimus TaxID=1636530 RepID=UPI001FAF84AC|nr:NADH dehydrogenase subunit 2 [Stenochironomus tobaduodecimus]UKO33033.1 NADH dehydrogenase subunit 2 [Stenochironomus tobaduodecimus]